MSKYESEVAVPATTKYTSVGWPPPASAYKRTVYPLWTASETGTIFKGFPQTEKELDIKILEWSEDIVAYGNAIDTIGELATLHQELDALQAGFQDDLIIALKLTEEANVMINELARLEA